MISLKKYNLILAIVILALPAHAIDYMYWDSNFGPISMLNISVQADVRQGSATATLYTSGNAEITADNTSAAQLSNGADTLITEYKLGFDGDGSSETGGTETLYESYDSFLSSSAAVTYVNDDNDVQVTLYVRTSNNPDTVADSGLYNATQTLTISWIGP